MDVGTIAAVAVCLGGAGVLWSVAWRSAAVEDDRRVAAASFWPDLEARREDERRRMAAWTRSLGVSHDLRPLQGDSGGHRALCACGWVSPVLVSVELATAAYIAHWQGAARPAGVVS